MIKSLSVLALAALSLAASPAPMAPREAIFAAADAAPSAVPGTFVMHVTATGRVGPRIYLNSEADYRDQRNLSIAISPWAAQQLAHRFGGAPEARLRGRTIAVRAPRGGPGLASSTISTGRPASIITRPTSRSPTPTRSASSASRIDVPRGAANRGSRALRGAQRP